MSGWNPITAPQDKVLLAGRWSPGIAEISGADSPRKWEEDSGTGFSGGVLRFHGLPLAHFSVYLYLYEIDDWDDWFRFRPLVMKPVSLRVPSALDISHPQLTEVGIHACVIENVFAPVQVENGVWQIQIACIEHRKLKATGVSTADGAEATPADPNDKTIGTLFGKFGRLLNKLGGQGNKK